MNAPKVMDKVNVCACTCARLSWGSEDLQLSSDFEPPSLIAPPPQKLGSVQKAWFPPVWETTSGAVSWEGKGS